MPRVTTISKEEQEAINNDAAAAEELLTDERFAFFREYLTSAMEYASTSIIENTIHDAEETITISDKLKKTFFTPKKVQVDELSGQYKLVKKLFEDLNQFVQTKRDLDAEIEAERVKVGD